MAKYKAHYSRLRWEMVDLNIEAESDAQAMEKAKTLKESVWEVGETRIGNVAGRGTEVSVFDAGANRHIGTG